MIIAVCSVRVMQMAVDQIVHVIAMRHGFVAAAGTVNVIGWMSATVVARRARRGIGCAHWDLVFVHMIAVRMMQVAIVQVVRVPIVLDRGVAAARAVLMIVVSVDIAGFVRGIVGHSMFLENWRIEFV
jgi:predicted ATPase